MIPEQLSFKTKQRKPKLMKKVEYSSLGLTVNLSVPETVDEFDKNAKKVGACLAEAINNIVYRGSLAEFRDIFLHGRLEEKDANGKVIVTALKGVDDITGIARKELPVLKDGKPVIRDGSPVTIYDPEDSEAKYFKRILAAANKKVEDFQAQADAVAAALVFDASATEKKPAGPRKLAQKYKDIAAAFLTGKRNLDKLQKALAKDLSGKQFVPVAGVPVTDEKNVEVLGWLCKEFEAAQDAFSKVG